MACCTAARIRVARGLSLDGRIAESKRRFEMRALVMCLALGLTSLCSGQTTDLRSINKIFIDKMPNDLDQYIRAEVVKQFKGRLTVVLNQADADAILTGVSEEEKG